MEHVVQVTNVRALNDCHAAVCTECGKSATCWCIDGAHANCWCAQCVAEFYGEDED